MHEECVEERHPSYLDAFLLAAHFAHGSVIDSRQKTFKLWNIIMAQKLRAGYDKAPEHALPEGQGLEKVTRDL
jgi:hypothetical protein